MRLIGCHRTLFCEICSRESCRHLDRSEVFCITEIGMTFPVFDGEGLPSDRLFSSFCKPIAGVQDLCSIDFVSNRKCITDNVYPLARNGGIRRVRV